MNKGSFITSGRVAQNRKARFNYQIEETFEAGLVLQGAEVKSLRAGRVNINEAFAEERGGELFLLNMQINAYGKGSVFKPEEKRARKLLLKKREINQIFGKILRKGYSLIPLDVYFTSKGLAKVKLGLGVGKSMIDKRQTEKDRDWKREQNRLMKRQA
ncbi:MAG: SsrA-binding protein SmpB [Alphaproteobacteria bacterium]|nr:SsrA-binding protein SmpB [Alphaproteobacteria bacterium]